MRKQNRSSQKHWAQAADTRHLSVWICFSSKKKGSCDCTTVGVDDLGLHKSYFEIVQDGRFVEVTEGGEVVLPDQDVWVAKGRESCVWRVKGMVVLLTQDRLCKKRSGQLFYHKTHSLHVLALWATSTHCAVLETQFKNSVSRVKISHYLGWFPHMFCIWNPHSVVLREKSSMVPGWQITNAF